MASISATHVTSNICHHIQWALFGRPGPVRNPVCSLDEVHQLSQEFSLASPMGGGGMLAIHALGHQTNTCRRDRRR